MKALKLIPINFNFKLCSVNSKILFLTICSQFHNTWHSLFLYRIASLYEFISPLHTHSFFIKPNHKHLTSFSSKQHLKRLVCYLNTQLIYKTTHTDAAQIFEAILTWQHFCLFIHNPFRTCDSYLSFAIAWFTVENPFHSRSCHKSTSMLCFDVCIIQSEIRFCIERIWSNK